MAAVKVRAYISVCQNNGLYYGNNFVVHGQLSDLKKPEIELLIQYVYGTVHIPTQRMAK
jgi:hypothetical protein